MLTSKRREAGGAECGAGRICGQGFALLEGRTMKLLRWLTGERTPAYQVNRHRAEDAIRVLYMRYVENINLSGRNILGLAGASRAAAKQLFPFLADPGTM